MVGVTKFIKQLLIDCHNHDLIATRNLFRILIEYSLSLSVCLNGIQNPRNVSNNTSGQ